MSQLADEDLNFQLQQWRGGNASPEGTMPVAPYMRAERNLRGPLALLAQLAQLGFCAS